ncbi:MAG: PEP-CTERM sorting domain-containing protein [Akkermansia muciniphila]|nr:PEP-CTERM sorting domain-containing protein [Akkermansia muciniphila]
MKLRLPKKLLSALLLACFMAAGSVYAAYTWSGTGEITDAAWKTPGNWTVDGSSSTLPAGKGPGVPESNAWGPIIVNDATGAVDTLEGWNVDMSFENTTLIVGNMKKIQNGVGVDAAKFSLTNSSLTLNLGSAQQQSMLVTLDATSTMNLNLSTSRVDGATTIDFGDLTAENVGKLNLGRKSGASGSYTSNLTIKGSISTGSTSEETTLHTVTLGTIGEGITLGTIDSSITAEGYSRAFGTLTASAYDIGTYSIVNDNGTLKLLYVTGTLTEYTWDGSNGSWNDDSWNGGNTFDDGNKVIINGGALSVDADTVASAYSVALNGGLLEIAGSLETHSLRIDDSAAIKLSGGSLTANALNTAQGLEISGNSTLNISEDSSSILRGTGNLTKTGSGILNLGASADSTMSGELTITGGKVQWGEVESSSNTIAFSKITVDGSSSQFYLSHASVDMSGQTGVELKNGGTLYSFDTDFTADDATKKNNQMAFSGLNVSGTGGKIQYYWGGSFSFEELTGDANLSIVNEVQSSWTMFKSIKDYNGEISSASDKHAIKLGTVDLAAGKTTTISGKFGSIGETVTKTGEGKLILAGNGVDAKTLDIQGGTVSWGSKADDNNAKSVTTVLGFSKVVINSDAQFEDSHKGGNTSTFDIEMNGGTLYAYDQNMGDSNELVKYGTLTIVKNTSNRISQDWKAYRNFAVLTGGEAGGDVVGTTLSVGGCRDNKQTLRIDSVTNFNGTLSSSSFDNNNQLLSIGAASQEEGFNAVIDAKATLTDGFEKTGSGTLTLSKSTKATGSVAIKAGTLSFTVYNEAMSVSEGSVITISGTGKFSHDGFNYTAKKVSSTVTEATEGSTSGSNEATITAGTGIGNLGLGNANLTIKDAVMEKTSAGAKDVSATLSNVDFTVSGGIPSDYSYTVKFMGSAAQSLSKLTIQSGNKVEVANSNFSTSVLDNSGTLQLAKADISIETVVLSGGTVTLGTEADHDAVLSTDSLTVSGDSMVNANLVLNGSSLKLNNALAMGSALTLNNITLSGDLLSGYIAENSTITLFTGVDSLTLGTGTASGDAITAGAKVDASDYFTNLGQGDFLLTYTGSTDGGIVALVAQRDVPEPTTATLSLLALMGLAARRRRRKA